MALRVVGEPTTSQKLCEYHLIIISPDQNIKMDEDFSWTEAPLFVQGKIVWCLVLFF